MTGLTAFPRACVDIKCAGSTDTIRSKTSSFFKSLAKPIVLFSFSLLVTRCSTVNFSDPHPSDEQALTKIGPDFVGKYYYTDSFIGKKDKDRFWNAKYFSGPGDQDSVTLFTAELLVTEKLTCYTLHFTGFFKLDGQDTARLNREFNYKNIDIKDKYYIHTEINTDTLLDLNSKDKLFFYKNRYYLNRFKKGDPTAGAENSWSICQLEKLGPELFSINLTDDQDYNLLFDTTKTVKSIFPIARLSNKKFKKFVDKGGFHQKYRLRKYPR